jgi:CMP-N-acetylneuraminic acid synthetase
MTREITAFLPCRAGSQRVPQKNTRPFGGVEDGLLGLKIDQLVACPSIKTLVVSSNDTKVLGIAEQRAQSNPKIKLDHRPEHLCTSQTSTDDVVAYVPTIIPDKHVLWTHVTSPFVGANEYEKMFRAYFDALENGSGDSLMSVTTLRTYVWTKTGPVNYDRAVEKWPATQSLPPMYAVNSAAFIIHGPLMRELSDRIGRTPVLFEMDEVTAFDIDWEEQFRVSEQLYRMRAGKNA